MWPDAPPHVGALAIVTAIAIYALVVFLLALAKGWLGEVPWYWTIAALVAGALLATAYAVAYYWREDVGLDPLKRGLALDLAYMRRTADQKLEVWIEIKNQYDETITYQVEGLVFFINKRAVKAYLSAQEPADLDKGAKKQIGVEDIDIAEFAAKPFTFAIATKLRYGEKGQPFTRSSLFMRECRALPRPSQGEGMANCPKFYEEDSKID